MTIIDQWRRVLFVATMEAPQRSPSEFLDMSLVDELEREGFVQKLYGN